jgi:hypothetical protein
MKWLRQIIFVIVVSLTFAGCSFDLLSYKAKSGLQVITNENSPSAVFLDGQYINKTPLIEKNLKPGVYHILIQPEDTTLVPYETDITLRKGLLTVITWKPDKRPELSSGVILEMEALEDKNKTELRFNSIPDGAILTLNGQKEFSPVTIPDVPAGEQEFDVTLPSYETQHHKIHVQTGYRTTVTVKLGKLQANGPTDPTANADASGSATASASTDVSSGLTASPSASAGATVAGTVTILKTGFMQNGTEVLRVRATPETTGAEVGFAPVGSSYPYLGEQKNGWYKITFNNSIGWVNGAYAQLK